MRKLCRGIAFFICAVLAVLTILLVLPGLFGIHPLTVQSGSMEPGYPVGSLIYVKQVDTTRLQEGAVVTFYLPDDRTLVTHRIVEIDKEKGVIYTKGDANELEDGMATPYSRIVGQPFLCIPMLGHLAGYLADPAGKAGILMLVILVCVLSWLESSQQRSERSYESKES